MDPFDQGYYRERYHTNPLQRLFGHKPGLLRRISRRQPGGRLLDIGCGIGMFLHDAARRYDAFGVEVSEYAAGQAARTSGLRGRICLTGGGNYLPFRSGSFSVITVLDVIEHISNHSRMLSELERLLTPGGIVAVSTPNPDSIGKKLKGDQWFGLRDPTHMAINPVRHWRSALEGRFTIIGEWYDGLWDAPYMLRQGPWRWPGLKQLAGLVESAMIVAPSVILTSAGAPIPRTLGENAWLLAAKPRAGEPCA
jgi:2-polyprenyl-3-methyl-5-hydroxy-6-metoxy-1,4-benzoquinol methylase